MRRLDSGKGTVKAIAAVAFLVAVAYGAIKIIPVYLHNYELQDYIRTQTPHWLTQRASDEAIRNYILAKAQDLEIPLGADHVKVEASGSRVTVRIDYTVPVDLIVYTLALHFTPSAENRSL